MLTQKISLNTLVFYMHRISGLILALYLCIHLIFLTTIVTGEYSSLIKITLSKTFLPLDLLLFLIGIFHGVNGIRLIIHELGFLYDYRNTTIYAMFLIVFAMWITVVAILGGVFS